MERIKENMHILLLGNFVLLVFLIFLIPKEGPSSFIVVDQSTNETENLRKIICQKAFKTWKEGSLSDFYMHPDIIEAISSSEEFNLEGAQNLYFKMDGREVCFVVVKTKVGFSAFEAVMSKDGPLMYRLTSLRSKKPTLTEIKDYL
jgi:hypothetical protein